jgi:hypothetical protein
MVFKRSFNVLLNIILGANTDNPKCLHTVIIFNNYGTTAISDCNLFKEKIKEFINSNITKDSIKEDLVAEFIDCFIKETDNSVVSWFPYSWKTTNYLLDKENETRYISLSIDEINDIFI